MCAGFVTVSLARLPHVCRFGVRVCGGEGAHVPESCAVCRDPCSTIRTTNISMGKPADIATDKIMAAEEAVGLAVALQKRLEEMDPPTVPEVTKFVHAVTKYVHACGMKLVCSCWLLHVGSTSKMACFARDTRPYSDVWWRVGCICCAVLGLLSWTRYLDSHHASPAYRGPLE